MKNRTFNIEQSIVKTYKKTIWNKFIFAINEYDLIKKHDIIAVCISGGKDSWLLAKCLERLEKYSDFPFKVKFISMNPGYNKENMEQIKKNIEIFQLDVKIFETNIFTVAEKTQKSPCYLCARMRRGYLYKFAQENGCNKIALGHHFDDVIETNLMSMIYAGQVRTMMPRVNSLNFKGMELVRPLYMVEEKYIVNWQNHNSLKFIKCGCPIADERYENKENTKRDVVKKLVKQLYEDNSQTKKNIFRSMQKVDLETILSYKDNNGIHSFLDNN